MLSTRFAVATLPRVSRLATRPVIARAYHEKVISHYERPRNVCLSHFSDRYLIISLFASPHVGGLPPQRRHRCRYWARWRTCVCVSLHILAEMG